MRSHESSSVGTSGGLPEDAAACANASAAPPIEKAMTTAPVLWSTERRENSVFAFMGFSSRHRIGGALHGAQDFGIFAPAAFPARQRLLGFGIGRVLFPC